MTSENPPLTRRRSATSTRQKKTAQTSGDPSGMPTKEEQDVTADLSFREAQTALELSLSELQSPDLDIEQMAGLYRRAQAYADRCERLLQQVEQEVMQWDPQNPDVPPSPLHS